MQMLRWPARVVTSVAIAFVLLAGWPMTALPQSGPFVVARLVVCEDVQGRTPVNVADVFPAQTETVFCFLEARDILETTDVRMVWYHEAEELASVPLTIRQGPRWRTYSSKKTAARKGNWKVYLLDGADNTLAAVQFVLE